MHFKFTKIIIIIISLSFASSLNASVLSEKVNQILGDTQQYLCSDLGFNQIDPFRAACGTPEISFKESDFQTIYAGRFLIANGLGCGTKNYDETKELKNNFNVALLGDSLTMFGGENTIWNLYLSGGRYKALALGAAGSTSSAWREHFENCEAGRGDIGFPTPNPNGRLQLPPRSIMMIGGNDFHVFKGILQPMWWLVDLRHNSVLNNVERIITHHHKGNNGCGDDPKIVLKPNGTCPDTDKNGAVNSFDWGRGRLFVSLGNIPAVSVDPTHPRLLTFLTIFQILGLMTPLAFDENTSGTLNTNEYDVMEKTLYITRRLLDTNVDIILKPAAEIEANFGGINAGKKNHAWVSREMHILQNKIQAVQIKRMGFMYVHMYKHFRNSAANSRGCFWCADLELWMDRSDIKSFNDGIHLSHVKGYTRWAQTVVPYMEVAEMYNHERTDIFGPPGAEIPGRAECDDLCLLVLCYYFGVCK